MTHKNRRPNPDDRSDNVDKLENMIQDTLQNIEESHETMQYVSNENKKDVNLKNKRRKEAIEGMREEIVDEHEHDSLNN